MKSEDWEELRPKFAVVRHERGLLSLEAETGCSRASIARWAAGKVTPRGLNARAVRVVVARHYRETSQVRREPQ